MMDFFRGFSRHMFGINSPYPILIILVLFGAVLLVLAGNANGEEPADFYQYQTTDGSLAFTDDPKRVPEAHQAEATARSWDELQQSTSNRRTVVEIPDSVPMPDPASIEIDRSASRDCSGPVRVTSERRQFGDRNREVFLYHDACGRLVSETFFQPDLFIHR